jgi:Lysozyme like domain
MFLVVIGLGISFMATTSEASTISALAPAHYLTKHDKHVLHEAHLRALASERSGTQTTSAGSGAGYATYYNYAGLESLWRAEGGPAWAAPTAACIAEHESGGYRYAVSPTADYGLWQIHDGGSAQFNPFFNARTAVIMSKYGTDWYPWTTRPYCV